MADELNSKNRDEQAQGDEAERDRSKQQQAGSKDRSSEEEHTDTLEDRNLSGSSTWATLPEDQNSSSDEDDSTSNR